MARNNGLSLVARLNISLSESQISEDLKKISDSLNDKSLPSFIAHINIQGSAAAINKELATLGKKLKVDFGQITEGTNKGKLKEAGKKVAQQVYNVHELKAAGRDYLYNANDIQKQIDQLQSRYDKRNISLQNSVNVSALTNEVGQVKALRVEYENLEHQMVRVDYIKAKFDNKKWGFVSTGANYIDKTEGKAYQETLSYMTKIESSFRKIHDSAIGFSSPIKEGSKFFDEYNAKAGKVAQTITEIRSENKILSDEQKTYISSLVSSFEAYVKNLKEAAKGATSLSPKNLSESIKQGNAELNTMLKNLTKNKQETGFLGNEYKKIYEDISELRTQLNSVTNGEEFALYSANLKLVREGIKQYNSDVANSTANQKLKSDMDDVNAKIMTFIRENKNLTDSYKQNLLDLAGKANQAKSGFELKGISGQANALMNAYTKSEDMSRSIRTLNSSLTVSEQKLLEMQNDTIGLDVEFQRLVDRTNEVRTNLGDVSTQSGLKNVKIEVAETKQAINDLYNTWKSRQTGTTTQKFNDGISSQLNKIDANARSVSSGIAKDSQLMQAYEAELVRVNNEIQNITANSEVLSYEQQRDIRNIVDNFRLYESELQNIAKANTKPTMFQDISVYDAQITSMIAKLDAMSIKVPESMTANFNALRGNLISFQNSLANVNDEKGLTNVAVNFKLMREEFNQFNSALNSETGLDNLINKIATLDTEMDSYLRTTTNITQAQRNYINSLRGQVNSVFNVTDLQNLETEFKNFVKTIATEQQRIGGVPLEDKLLHTQEVLVTLRTSVVAHQQEVGSLGSSYGQLISEIDRFITGINNGAITSKDDFEIMENSIGQLQERIKQTGIEIKSDLNFLSVNNSVRTLVSDINTYLANNLNLPERFRQQAEAIVYELNHTTDKITFDDLKVRWHELVSAINSEVIKVGGVDIAEKVNTGVEALNVLRQTLVSQKSVVGNLDGTYRELLTDIDNLKLAAQNIYSPDQYNAWANDAANVQKRVEQLKNSISSTTGINQLAVQAANLSTKINLFISENSRLSENAKTKLRELANQAQQAQSKMDLSNINTQFNTFTMKLKEAGKLGTSIIDKLKQNISKFSAWFGMTTIIMRVITLMRQMITNVKELDTAMVNLKKVTDETDQSYQNFFKRAGESAQELHADMTNLIDATAEFAKLGYSIGEAEELSKVATVYSNVGELDSIQDATESIVSTMKAFKVEANDAMQIVDKFNKVGKSLPIRYSNVA